MLKILMAGEGGGRRAQSGPHNIEVQLTLTRSAC